MQSVQKAKEQIFNDHVCARCSDYLVIHSPDTQIGDERAAAEENGPDVVHHDCLYAPVGVEHGQGAEQGVSHWGGPEKGDNHSGHLWWHYH